MICLKNPGLKNPAAKLGVSRHGLVHPHSDISGTYGLRHLLSDLSGLHGAFRNTF